MNVKSNTYTYIYSSIVVIIVATLLALAATALKPAQDRNIEIEKKLNILASLRINANKNNVQQLYEKYITDRYIINSKGIKQQGADPFYINLREELKKPVDKRLLPVFEAKKNDSSFIIIPVYGKGLWGPIWGYVSLLREKDTKSNIHYRKIYGVIFDHKGETPGLGAEINQEFFQLPFRGKVIFDEKGIFTPVKVVKGGANPASLTEVDGISGGTITSKGVQAMLDTCLVSYQHFFKTTK